MNKKTIRRGLLPYLLITVVMFGVFFLITVLNRKINHLTYDKFISERNCWEIKRL